MIGLIGGRDAGPEPVEVPLQVVLCQLVAHGDGAARFRLREGRWCRRAGEEAEWT